MAALYTRAGLAGRRVEPAQVLLRTSAQAGPLTRVAMTVAPARSAVIRSRRT